MSLPHLASLNKGPRAMGDKLATRRKAPKADARACQADANNGVRYQGPVAAKSIKPANVSAPVPVETTAPA